MAGGGQEQALSAGWSRRRRPLLTEGTMTEKRAFFGEPSTRVLHNNKQWQRGRLSLRVGGGGSGLKSSK